MTTTARLTRDTLETPFGQLTLVGSDRGLRAILWPDDDPSRVGLTGTAMALGSCTVLAETARQLDAYFAGTRTAFHLPVDLRGTVSQLAAWRALSAIPYGETRTYSEQASTLGRPAAARAVGAANGRNPLSIVLPCHRVIGSNGALTGFAGGIDVKRALLEHESRTAR
jgi:methylated-DNA-[protein]-cysteine S-methyltransferase